MDNTKKQKVMRTMDGNEAAAYSSYAFTELAAIYPITPSSPMAELVDKWASLGKKNIFGKPVELVEMQSEAGAIATVHGASESGCLASTYTASQGLLLMIPTMFRLAGQQKPSVIHVAARTVATNAISILAEHSDVMSCRQTGYAMLCASSVQEAMEMSAIAHLSAIKGHMPFLHFFDGFRTSHEIQKVEVLDYKDLAELVDYDELEKFRKSSLNPDRPVIRTSGMGGDTYFQIREACNPVYDALPDIVEDYMEKIGALTGRKLHLFNYYGAPDADRIIISLGSVAGALTETVDYANARGEKVGFINVHLYRPFSTRHLFAAIPETVRAITVLDRTKEPGAVGEPLYEDVCAALYESGKDAHVYACRFGLSGKDTTPEQLLSVYENMAEAKPKDHFTIGINDDVTHLSLKPCAPINTVPAGTVSCKFWGLGSDGTVGANKNSIKIIGDHTDKYVQAYFEYDGKKTGGTTKSHLRFGDHPITSSYLVNGADFVACHNQAYLKTYDMIQDLRPGGTFLLACSWSQEELNEHLPAAVKAYAANNNIQFYTINAGKIARELGLGNRINVILQAAFFKLTEIIPYEEAVEYIKQMICKSYSKAGEQVVAMNCEAVDRSAQNLVKIQIPESWKDAKDSVTERENDLSLPAFISEILNPVNAMHGDDIPVSVFSNQAADMDGTFISGSSAYEKRGTSSLIPEWDSAKCIQCNQCSFVCSHSTIRPFLLDESQLPGLETVDAKGTDLKGLRYRIQVSVLDCVGCGSCVKTCPTDALRMVPLDTQTAEVRNWENLVALPARKNPMNKFSVKGSQFEEVTLQFPGACGGCGETPYARLVTQLFGDRMCIANSIGCSQVWATSFPCFPYSKTQAGYGPALGGSLFENNAEYGLGIQLGIKNRREQVRESAKQYLAETKDTALKAAGENWLANFDNGGESREAGKAFRAALEAHQGEEKADYLLANSDQFVKPSVWFFGGDGWAYDIGFGGLDHVLASGENVNVLVFDTEVYSNTGGQSSKATPFGAVAQFASDGKRTGKKDLGMMAMTYGNVYVAQVAMGADKSQLLKAVQEAEAYDGPSLIICYAPCISHGLKCGMSDVQGEMKRAVEAGYWHLYRYNPTLIAEGKNPFTLDSAKPTGDLQSFLLGETRYTQLKKNFPEKAKELFQKNAAAANARYERYQKLSE